MKLKEEEEEKEERELVEWIYSYVSRLLCLRQFHLSGGV